MSWHMEFCGFCPGNILKFFFGFWPHLTEKSLLGNFIFCAVDIMFLSKCLSLCKIYWKGYSYLLIDVIIIIFVDLGSVQCLFCLLSRFAGNNLYIASITEGIVTKFRFYPAGI